MGIGKTTVCHELKKKLSNSVFLDGDWCWDANPFQVNDETKKMVMHNICFLLNQFIHCSCYENIIFCWVMDKQSIIDTILASIDKRNYDIKVVSLLCNQDTLRKRLENDVQNGIRTEDVINRSIGKIPLYENLRTEKIITDNKEIYSIVDSIIAL